MLIYCKGKDAEKKSSFSRIGSSFRSKSYDRGSGKPPSVRRGSVESKVDGSMEGLVFKGRIPTSNLTFMNLEDGKGYVQTNGNAVEHAFKISNEAKGKWYILSCRTAEEKAGWIDAIQTEKKRLANTQDGRTAFWSTQASANVLGDDLRAAMLADGMIRDRK